MLELLQGKLDKPLAMLELLQGKLDKPLAMLELLRWKVGQTIDNVRAAPVESWTNHW